MTKKLKNIIKQEKKKKRKSKLLDIEKEYMFWYNFSNRRLHL